MTDWNMGTLRGAHKERKKEKNIKCRSGSNINLPVTFWFLLDAASGARYHIRWSDSIPVYKQLNGYLARRCGRDNALDTWDSYTLHLYFLQRDVFLLLHLRVRLCVGKSNPPSPVSSGDNQRLKKKRRKKYIQRVETLKQPSRTIWRPYIHNRHCVSRPFFLHCFWCFLFLYYISFLELIAGVVSGSSC